MKIGREMAISYTISKDVADSRWDFRSAWRLGLRVAWRQDWLSD